MCEINADFALLNKFPEKIKKIYSQTEKNVI